MRIFFSVGEPSGDLHAANLIRDLRAIDSNLEAVGFGGPKMEQAGCQLLFELTTLAVMGLINVVKNIRQFFGLLAEADRYLASHEVDAVVLVDYPGFNWWIARAARKRGVPVFYYGVPQMWAWAPWRIKKLKRLVDHVLCKLPFEEAWFRERGCDAKYVGHPYFDEVCRYQHDEVFRNEYDVPGSRLLVLLPGSRTQEVHKNLITLLKSAQLIRGVHPEVAVAVACFSHQHAEFAREICCRNQLPFDVMVGRTPELISMSDACIACSGSVSLELLYYRKPSVIVYRVPKWSIWLGRLLLQTRYITLVNLLGSPRIEKQRGEVYDPDQRGAETAPMPEYLTTVDCSAGVARWVQEWLDNPELLTARVETLDQLAQGFAEPGASMRAARHIASAIAPHLQVDDTRDGDRVIAAAGILADGASRPLRRAA